MLNKALYHAEKKTNFPNCKLVLLLSGIFSLMLLTSGCQKHQEFAPQTADTAAEKTPKESNSSQTANSETPAAPQVETIDPTMVIKAGQPMTAKRFNAVKARLSQIGLAFHNFIDKNRYFLPSPEQHPEYYDESGRLKVSWRVHLLPFLDQNPLYEQFKLDEAWDSPHNAPLAKKMPEAFHSPDTPIDSNLTRFRVFEGKWDKEKKSPSTVFPMGAPTRIRDVKDGSSNTTLVVEVGPDKAIEWTKPGGLNFEHPIEEFGASASGIPVLLVDGSTKQIKRDITESKWKEIIGPQDLSRIDWKNIEVQ
ncbi:hypothetical protein Pan241w_32200 [Gimesia alba]|uniref:DUF1559 domain-containing protein n=1 Tax=Gimesia alba TaxID=2527973 RepID=A0A517RGY1_9PLAN|nr:DUF1559 domain-containing protein [Gimesia alba]QDT43122.1 hypothetical protein Pan241w_32200 [Gimesia alba]